MVTDVGMSAAVAIVTSSATMETSCRATAESGSTAAVKSSSATMTTVLGKSSLWQPAKRANADDCEKNSQKSRFHHFRGEHPTHGLRVPAVRHAEHCHS
jgi:hypothetical protein